MEVTKSDDGPGDSRGTDDGINQDVYKLAEELSVEVFPEDPMYLQLDLDHGDHVDDTVLDFLYRRKVILDSPDSILVTKSRRGNRHWYVPLREPLPYEDRAGLQAALGSDSIREARGLYHHRHGTRRPAACLFETPVEAKRVQDWLDIWVNPRRAPAKPGCLDGPMPTAAVRPV